MTWRNSCTLLIAPRCLFLSFEAVWAVLFFAANIMRQLLAAVQKGTVKPLLREGYGYGQWAHRGLRFCGVKENASFAEGLGAACFGGHFDGATVGIPYLFAFCVSH